MKAGLKSQRTTFGGLLQKACAFRSPTFTSLAGNCVTPRDTFQRSLVENRQLRKLITFVSLGFALVSAGCMSVAAPVPAKVVEQDGKWQLLRDGKPYFIKGVGGSQSKDLIVKYGGNSFRTWGADNLNDQLDDAQRLGLTVAVGFWLGHKRHGFDYHNEKSVREQFERAREAVHRYRDHPAVLIWGIGNEMENYEPAGDTAVWKAIEDIAAMIKKEDPNHPTMTVIAEVGGDKIAQLHKLCPSIDIVGINTYGGGESIPERYQKAGGTKPYVITEFGPLGTWEVKPLPMGAIAEMSSTEKAEWYRRTYTKAIAGAKGQCLGSYVFAWGSKREATATWFGMFLPDGNKLAAVDVIRECWTGTPVANPCPRINSLKLAESDGIVETGATVRVVLDAAGVNDDPIKVSWELHRDWFEYETGGDTMPEAPQYPKAIIKANNHEAELQMPAEGGGYRLYAIVRSEKGGAAVANVPLLVKGPAPKPRAHKAELPLVIFSSSEGDAPYVPSGWLGSYDAIRYVGDCLVNPHSGKTCLKLEFRDKTGWGGITWQSPPNDWGDKPGGFDLSGAKALTFWARGEEGGEKVEFFFGGIRSNKPFFDSAEGKIGVELTKDWQQYTIDLTGKDLSSIKSGFGWTLRASGKPITFYLDDIRYE